MSTKVQTRVKQQTAVVLDENGHVPDEKMNSLKIDKKPTIVEKEKVPQAQVDLELRPEGEVKMILREKKDVVVVSDSDDPSVETKAAKTALKEKAVKKSKGSTKKKSRIVQDQESSMKKQTTLTQHFKVRRSERTVKSREKEHALDVLQKQILTGTEEGLETRVIKDKGRGIFALKKFRKGDFVCEYAGELIDGLEAKAREAEYEKDEKIGSYMYFFEYKNRKYCVDATAESPRLGRLLNHSKTESNVTTQLFPIKDVPYLILIASKDIEPEEELLYDYGDRSQKSLESHPWLAL